MGGAVAGGRPGFQYRARRAGAADAADAGLFRGGAACDTRRVPDLPLRHLRDDGNVPRLFHRHHARPDAVKLKADRWPTKTTPPTNQKTQPRNVWTTPMTAARSPTARRPQPGS